MFDLWILERTSARKVNESENLEDLKAYGLLILDNAEDIEDCFELTIADAETDETAYILNEETGWRWEGFDKFISRA